jgi:hypothetical protein
VPDLEYASRVEVWSGAPTTLKAYAVLTVLWPAASAVGTGHLYHLAFVPLNALINYFLLKGVRWLWWFLVAGGALGILSDLTGGIAWYYLVGFVITLALLLLPETRRHFSSAKHRDGRIEVSGPC